MEALANQYKGVSLFETEFNKENMTPVQLELYNKVLDLQYDIALQNGSAKGMSREQYKQYLSNAIQGFIIQPRNTGHGLISVDVLETVLDTALNVVLIIGSFGWPIIFSYPIYLLWGSCISKNDKLLIVVSLKFKDWRLREYSTL